MLRPRRTLLVLVPTLVLAASSCLAQSPRAAALTDDVERSSLHNSEEWHILAPHLPAPDTGTAAQLETAADVLRARRFPEDALDYYNYAIARGGNVGTLLNKMGIVRMELRQYDIARQMFTRVVRANKKNALAWNNLGAVEFMTHRYGAATSDYRKAVSLDKKSATFHANLGLVYFESGNVEDARTQFQQAAALDPEVMQHRDNGGVSAHVLESDSYPRLCYEFARMAALNHNAPAVREWLARAAEGGVDLQDKLHSDPILSSYTKDPEVVLLLANARQLRSRKVAANKPIPSLGPQADRTN